MVDTNEPARHQSSPDVEGKVPKLLEGYPPSSGPNSKSDAIATPSNVGHASSLDNAAVRDLPKFSGLAMTSFNESGRDEPQDQPTPADNYINIQSKFAANALSEGRFNNETRLTLDHQLKRIYELGGPEAEQKFLNKVNGRLKEDQSQFRLTHTVPDANNPTKKVYHLANTDTGETRKLGELDLKDPKREELSPVEKIADYVDRGTFDPQSKDSITGVLREAYKRGGTQEELKLLEQINTNLKEIGSPFSLETSKPSPKPGDTERDYRIVDKAGIKDSLKIDLDPGKNQPSPAKDLTDRFRDGSISLDDRIALENAMKTAYKRDGDPGLANLLTEINTKLGESNSSFRIAPGKNTIRNLAGKAFDLVNTETGDKKQITNFVASREPKPIPSQFISDKLLGSLNNAGRMSPEDDATVCDALKTAFRNGKTEELDQLLTDITSRLRQTNPDLTFEDTGVRGNNPLSRAYRMVDKTGNMLSAVSVTLNDTIENP